MEVMCYIRNSIAVSPKGVKQRPVDLADIDSVKLNPTNGHAILIPKGYLKMYLEKEHGANSYLETIEEQYKDILPIIDKTKR